MSEYDYITEFSELQKIWIKDIATRLCQIADCKLAHTGEIDFTEIDKLIYQFKLSLEELEDNLCALEETAKLAGTEACNE